MLLNLPTAHYRYSGNEKWNTHIFNSQQPASYLLNKITKFNGDKKINLVTLKYHYLIISLIVSGSLNYANGQQIKPSIALIENKITTYNKTIASDLLFLHFDKNIYTNSEEVWFTAYLLNSSFSINNYTVLSAVLVADNDHKPCLERKFPMANGFSFGHLVIPDTIPPGNYHIMAYNNLLDKGGRPLDVFSQAITIKTIKALSFKATLAIVSDSVSKVFEADLNIKNNDGNKKFLTDIDYSLGKKTVHVKNIKGNVFKILIPRDSISEITRQISVAVKQNKEVLYLNLTLPQRTIKPIIKFYPEGGNLIAGRDNTIGWEAKSQTGAPLKVRAILFKDGKPVDSIETNTYGIGRFHLFFQRGSLYYLQLTNTKLDMVNKYKLPEPLFAGVGLHVQQALADDTLMMQVQSSVPQKVMLLIHNFRDVFAFQQIAINASKKTIKVLLNEAPPGLSTITILDTLGHPLTERIFFAHYKDINKFPVIISSDHNQYAKRQKVNITLKLSNANEDVKGVVSIACIHESRIETRKYQNIQSYVYLDHFLSDLPVDITGNSIVNKDYVEDVLLVKGWSRYKWQDLLKSNLSDSLNVTLPAIFMGTVTKSNKPLKQPISMILMNHGHVAPFVTNDKGYFELTRESILAPPDTDITLMVSENVPERYELKLMDPSIQLNETLAKDITAVHDLPSYQVSSDETKLPGIERIFALQEVVIHGQKDNSIYDLTRNFYKDQQGCGDYLCIAGVLNCDIHPAIATPIPGQRYYYPKTGEFIIYTKCLIPLHLKIPKESYKISFKGLNMPKEFYQVDSLTLQTPEPQFLSTLYWNYQVNLTSKKEEKLSFYTGDIAGRYKFIVQGVTNKGVLHNEVYFDVK
jgi:hypothetical protein